MPRRSRTREREEVLVRGPWLAESPSTDRPVIDPVGQLDELTALLERGVLSFEEFDRQRRKVGRT